MSDAQAEFLAHLWSYGDDDIFPFSTRVISACHRNGWIKPHPEGAPLSGKDVHFITWEMTDAGRLALHEATS